jgi:23S rRNA (guanine745-N1)-methyltransferase
VTAGLDAALPLLACPHCARPLTRHDEVVVGCDSGHRFDIARQGQLTLLGPGARTDTGDTADMVAARQAFLSAGHFAPMTAAIVAAAGDGPVLELGAGTGHHIRDVVEHRPQAVGLAIDTSKYAARRAARVHPRVGSVVADAWSRLPVRDGVVGTLLSVFAPRTGAEVGRVLRPGGRAVVVTPTPEHQAELRSRIHLLSVEPDKALRLPDQLVGLEPAGRTDVRHMMRLTRDDVDLLIRMGPSAHHLPTERRRAAVADLEEVTGVTLAVTVSVFTAPGRPG